MPSYDSVVKFGKIPVQGLVVEQTASDLASPIEGQLETRTDLHQLFAYLNNAWVRLDNAGLTTAPSGPAGGDLAGTYPNPTVALLAITAAKIANATITDAQVATANKDGGTSVPSLRTLGTGALQAMTGAASLATISTNNPAAGAIDANSQKIINLQNNPTGGTDAANKNYVDSVAQGLDVKPSCRVAVATPAGSYSTGTSQWTGVGTAIAGVTLSLNDRVLVLGPHIGAGIFQYSTAASGTLSRTTDLDSYSEFPGAFVFVEEGGVPYQDTGWVCTNDQSGSLNTTTITWSQFAGAGTVVDGAALLKTGNVLDVQVDNASIEIVSDKLNVKALGITNAMLAGGIDLSSKVTGILAPAAGGTGANATSAAGQLSARQNLGVAGNYATLSPSLTAGVWATITHNLQAPAKHVSFYINQVGDPNVGEGRILDWRVNQTNPNTQVDIRCDVVGGRAASYYAVNVAA